MSIVALPGAPPDTPTALCVTRGAGVALLSLGVAYWSARNDTYSAAARGLVLAMLLYNGAFIFLLAYAPFGPGLNGIGLAPGILLHIAMVIWCILCLRRGPRPAIPATPAT